MKPVIVLLIFCLYTVDSWPDSYNGFGGYTGLSFPSTGHFYATQQDDVWWLVDPVGGAFLLKSIQNADYGLHQSNERGRSLYAERVRELYDHDEDAWAATNALRLKRWGFNSLGPQVSQSLIRQMMPFIHTLSFAQRGSMSIPGSDIVDVFSRRFQAGAKHIAMTKCRDVQYDPNLIGYRIDSDADWLESWTLLASFAQLDPDSDGYMDALRFLMNRHGSLQDINTAWGTEFRAFEDLTPASVPIRNATYYQDQEAFRIRVLDKYLSICSEVIRETDPRHLVFSPPLSPNHSDGIWRVVGRECDIVVIALFRDQVSEERLREIYANTQRPLLIELHAPRNIQQQDSPCEDAVTGKILSLMELPFVVGYDWTTFAPAARVSSPCTDLVDWNDRPRELFVSALSEVNQQLETKRIESVRSRLESF